MFMRPRLLVQDGKLYEAQAILEAGDPDALHGAAFDELRATVQRRLIEAGRKQAGFSPAADADGPWPRVPATTRGGAK